jgi:FtsP/CotA-like multicopper oxidase with cupredoxin domain
VVEGDRVRIFVTNRLPEHTTIHWHGQRLPNGMDGVGGLTQPHIPHGQDLRLRVRGMRRPGTFMYHPHADEMVQMAMGMMGFFVTHPRAGPHPLIARSTATTASCSTPSTSSRAPTRRTSTPCSTSTCGPGTAGSSRASTRWWRGSATGCASASAT